MATITTGPDTLQKLIESRVAERWGFTPVQYPGVQGLVNGSEDQMLDAPPANAPWLKVDILPGQSVPGAIAYNGGLTRTPGVIQLTIFAPRGDGMAQVNDLAGFARPIFDGYVGSGLYCETSGYPQPVPNNEGWLQVAVRTPFEWQETRATG